MTTHTDASTDRSRRSVGAVVLIVACALACTLPVIGGLLAGTFLDRFLDSPGWLGLVASVGVGVGVMVILRRRGIGASNEC